MDVAGACRQRSRVFGAGDARSRCENRYPAGDRPRNTEKSSTGNFFVCVCLAYRSQGVVSIARQHGRTFQEENALLPRHRLARGKRVKGIGNISLRPRVERVVHHASLARSRAMACWSDTVRTAPESSSDFLRSASVSHSCSTCLSVLLLAVSRSNRGDRSAGDG